MERNQITKSRAGMVALIPLGLFLLNSFKDSPEFGTIAFFIGLTILVVFVFFLNNEAEWSKQHRKEREVDYYEHKHTPSEGSSLYRFILILAAIATIIMAIVVLSK